MQNKQKEEQEPAQAKQHATRHDVILSNIRAIQVVAGVEKENLQPAKIGANLVVLYEAVRVWPAVVDYYPRVPQGPHALPLPPQGRGLFNVAYQDAIRSLYHDELIIEDWKGNDSMPSCVESERIHINFMETLRGALDFAAEEEKLDRPWHKLFYQRELFLALYYTIVSEAYLFFVIYIEPEKVPAVIQNKLMAFYDQYLPIDRIRRCNLIKYAFLDLAAACAVGFDYYLKRQLQSIAKITINQQSK